MKKSLTAIVLIAACLMIIPACKQNFDITAPYKETPVVYGILNTSATNNFIRIQKGFLVDGNAILAAGVPDSIYYSDSLNVELVELPDGPRHKLIKVNGEDYGLKKDSGIFASSPNVLYLYSGGFTKANVRLEVTNTKTGTKFSAQTPLVYSFIVGNNKGDKLKLTTSNPAKIRWNTPDRSGLFDVKVRFPYLEYATGSNTVLLDTAVEFYIVKSLPSVSSTYSGGDLMSTEFSTSTVLAGLRSAIPIKQGIDRVFNASKGMTITIYAGGEELAKYVDSKAAQSGLVSNEAIAPYTNVVGGYGLLSAVNESKVDSILLNEYAIDTLACHPVSSPLRFRRFNGSLCN